MGMKVSWLQCIFISLLMLLPLSVALWRRVRPCSICRSYLTGSWTAEFDNLSDWYSSLLSKSPTLTIHNHLLRSIVTANPKNVEHILRTRFYNYPKGKAFSAVLHDLLGCGIFNVDGDRWLSQRKLASQGIGSARARAASFVVLRALVQDRLLPAVASAACFPHGIDLQDLLRSFFFECICRSYFGVSPQQLELDQPAHVLADAFDSASRISACRGAAWAPFLWKAKRLLCVGSERDLQEAVGVVQRLADEIIRKRRALTQATTIGDLLAKFMSTTSDDRLLRDIVINFMLAGRDTVASALAAFFWLVSRHPHVELSILDELQRVVTQPTTTNSTTTHEATKETITTYVEACKEEAGGLEYAQLKDLHYLQAAICESLRLYPPVQFDSKRAVEDDKLPDGTFVRRGTRVTYHPYAMGRMESIWGADCHEFRPERWLKDGEFVAESPYKYPVFQAGRRVCLGKEIALMQMKCVAAAIFRKFTLQTEPSCNRLDFSPGLTSNIRGGLTVIVKPRPS
uniref:Cytochrome P450 n=1 Tax=Nymphaea colorata TaxID=210225 RepID=A0A5K0XFW9_9MAGN